MQAVLMIAAAFLAESSEPGPTGAAVIFTSPHPVAMTVRELMADGQLAQAEELLKTRKATLDPADGPIVEDGLETIRRYRREYSLDEVAMVAKLAQSIPDVTAEDVRRWKDRGEIQWRLIDGQVRYFRREPSNLMRFCAEAKRRRDEHAARQAEPAEAEPKKPTPKERQLAHLADVVAEAEKTGRSRVLGMRHRVRYRLTIPVEQLEADALVRCWLPFPQSYRQQQQVRLIRTSPTRRVLAPNIEDGEVLSGAPQRTVYLERRVTNPGEPLVFEETFEYVSFAYYPHLDDAEAKPLTAGRQALYLLERPPHILFTPELAEMVEQVVGDEKNPLARARAIYRFVAGSIRYCSEEEYAVIPSFSAKALTSGRGDCGVQAMLFITMCRAAGIPARWQSGFETLPGAWNMHDWAEFYVEPWGWLPADVSDGTYGLQESTDVRIREFYFGHLDAYRLIVNLDYGSPLHPPKKSLRSEPADFQRGEVEINGRNLYYDAWDWDFQCEIEPVQD